GPAAGTLRLGVALDLGLEAVHPVGDKPADELALGGEVVEQAALGHARLAGHRVEGEPASALAADHPRRRGEQPPPGGAARAGRRRGHEDAPPALRPTTPAMIRAIEASLSAVALSPKAKMPIAAISAVPTPDHTAYTKPMSSSLRISASSQK